MSFVAKYDGWCHGCRQPINEGDRLEWVDGEVVHEDCVPDAVREEPPRPTCPTCWQIVSVTGACGCDPE